MNSDSSNLDNETQPDEENDQHRRKEKAKSWIATSQREGPNINLKNYNKKYSNQIEKNYFFAKIKRKRKTELCKNFELYNDCFFKDECSFAHGIEELRKFSLNDKYKDIPCFGYVQSSFCPFGLRCNYQHIYT